MEAMRCDNTDCDSEFESFVDRHIGPRDADIEEMLGVLGLSSLDQLVAKTVPQGIRMKGAVHLSAPKSETEVLEEIRSLASNNRVCRSYIGLGFNDCITPPVIQRNILENPGWYTQYTPYQPEIAQGRLEALLNFQTMVCDLTGMELANSSLLDEGTAAAEAMTLCSRMIKGSSRCKFFVAEDVHPPTIEVVKTRANPLGYEVVVGDPGKAKLDQTFFGALLQYPGTDGLVREYRPFCDAAHEQGILVVAACDLLSLALFPPPGEWGADVVVGNSQRFGVPLGFGGPHAAFLACSEQCKREIPGRLVGVSKDSMGRPAYRLALQTREQHIRREKATSNICTAQVLLAIIASTYAVYHGPQGIRRIAEQVHRYAYVLAKGLERLGISIRHQLFFDTIRTEPLKKHASEIIKRAEQAQINFRVFDDQSFGISLDETTSLSDLDDILQIFAGNRQTLPSARELLSSLESGFPHECARTSEYLTHSVFNSYHSETELVRYLQRLQSKDLSLTTSMIPLGSCTMKLNATAEMVPITWPEFSRIHPFAPAEQTEGYRELISQLEQMLAEITGLPGVSLQPNAGSQGEYAGLLVIRAYHHKRGDKQRNVCLIPQSAHGTNPASATLAGMKVVVVKCDEEGNVDLADLEDKAKEYQDTLSALMVTYPSTHGVFEPSIGEICRIVHEHGGQVYMDGANLNAMVGLCLPSEFGVDVCHLNLHKTFSIPHGGGGPGVGPIACAAHLAPFLPGHIYGDTGGKEAIGAVSSSPWGSPSVLPISWVYIRMMGLEGLRKATQVAILNANYVAKSLEEHFPVLYKGEKGMIAHECILDLRRYKRAIGIEVADVAKRLMDFGFHAPTVAFPVPETLMVEPTESESKAELDRFCEALIAIRNEIREVEEGLADKTDNVLKNAPHPVQMVTEDLWERPYTRESAAYPLPWLREYKFWPAVGRIDNAFGDRNLFCSCVPMEEMA